MASFCRKFRGLPLFLPLALAMTVAAQEPARQLPIVLDAGSLDYRADVVVLEDVEISQGDLQIRAERAEATGIDFENSRWVFAGDVRIRGEQRGSLQSEQAVVEFRDNRVASATITGTPARFEQARAGTDLAARGRASIIEYDVSEGTVRLRGNAWLTDERNEISGPLLVYDVRREAIQATSPPGGDDRVRITILPGQEPGQDGE